MKFDHDLPLENLELTNLPEQDHTNRLLTDLELPEGKLNEDNLPLLDKEELLEGDLALLPLNEGEQEELLLLNSLNTLDGQDKLTDDQLLLNN